MKHNLSLLELAEISVRILNDIINGDVDEWLVDGESLTAEELLIMYQNTINEIKEQESSDLELDLTDFTLPMTIDNWETHNSVFDEIERLK